MVKGKETGSSSDEASGNDVGTSIWGEFERQRMGRHCTRQKKGKQSRSASGILIGTASQQTGTAAKQATDEVPRFHPSRRASE